MLQLQQKGLFLMADSPKKLSIALLESYKHHLLGLLHNNNSLYITYADGMEAYGENFVYNMLGIEDQITPQLADLNNSDDLQDFAWDYNNEYDLAKIDPKHYEDAAISEHLYLAVIDNSKRSIVNPRELFDFDYDLGVDNLHENLHDFALNLYQKDQNWHKLLNKYAKINTQKQIIIAIDELIYNVATNTPIQYKILQQKINEAIVKAWNNKYLAKVKQAVSESY